MSSIPSWKKVLREHVSVHGGRMTPRRMQIAEVFFSMHGHPGIEALLAEVRTRFPGIGEATVYRTMKLLCEAGLAEAREFGEGYARFEATFTPGGPSDHHDHLICLKCGAIVEFGDPEIELLQDRAATNHGFEIRSHRLEIFGVCPTCRKAASPSRA